MPVRHVVMFSWNDDVPPSHAAAVSAALTELPTKIPEIRAYSFGPDLGVVEGNADYVVVADFDDAEAFTTYREHPAHTAFVADYLTGKVASRRAVQYEI